MIDRVVVVAIVSLRTKYAHRTHENTTIHETNPIDSAYQLCRSQWDTTVRSLLQKRDPFLRGTRALAVITHSAGGQKRVILIPCQLEQ